MLIATKFDILMRNLSFLTNRVSIGKEISTLSPMLVSVATKVGFYSKELSFLAIGVYISEEIDFHANRAYISKEIPRFIASTIYIGDKNEIVLVKKFTFLAIWVISSEI